MHSSLSTSPSPLDLRPALSNTPTSNPNSGEDKSRPSLVKPPYSYIGNHQHSSGINFIKRKTIATFSMEEISNEFLIDECESKYFKVNEK